jgi:hypothetical protein
MFRELVKAAGDLGKDRYYKYEGERSEKIVIKSPGSDLLSPQPLFLGF